jgi:hypothetical protein
MQIVMDTNVWVSGLLWRGAPWQMVRLIEDGAIEVYITQEIVSELRRVLHYARLQRRLNEMQQTVDNLITTVVNLTTTVETRGIEPVVLADPNDDMFLSCALFAGVQYLVSGDHHLLDLKEWRGIQIVTVNDFLANHFPVKS